MTHPAVWGGLECTVNRVGDSWFDQVARSGHDMRLADIDRFADLGIEAIRYPLLWERLAPDRPAPRWERIDPFMDRLMASGLQPIAGLVHHGSGPRYTSLLDRNFGERLADFASAVARRYSHIRMWTPVNEPLTTARFCGLYGHWHPHGRDDATFVRVLLNQCRGIVLAMRAIRAEQALARFVYTDDGGTVFSTEPLAEQATFENARRDLALDLLFGRCHGDHPLVPYLLEHGASEAELVWFQSNPCVPDVLGVDYYATSDRWLDHRVDNYPSDVVGGERRHYADVAAATHAPGWRVGFAAALERWYQRYGQSVALTEVHLGCTREEQLRWLHAAWSGACEARAGGVPVEAVTAWALLGTHDWNVLATQETGHYESGAFDIRAPVPRPTAIASAVEELVVYGAMTHPVVKNPGWWSASRNQPLLERPSARSRILLLGANGTLGSAFARHCTARGIPHLALTRAEVDITDAMQVRRAVAACRPWAVINATGFVRVDDAETQYEACMSVNATGALHVGEACRRSGARLLTFSSDLVFDGTAASPYVEADEPNPLGVYGASKHLAETGLLANDVDAMIVRTSAFFGPWDEANFVTRTLRDLTLGRRVHAPTSIITATYVPALVDAALDLLIDGESGLWHLSNAGTVSWAELARRAAEAADLDATLIEESGQSLAGWLAPRPMFSPLASRRSTIMPSLDESLAAYMSARQRHVPLAP
ncbi:MAG: sugar nucleotide-binding protein [Cytophagaceae bacterium]|nr:sugar nucleotide-binding protein [Gemmatimonadaceae bacterium]